MKRSKSVRLYNVLFPIWFLMYLFPSWLPPVMLVFNFASDTLVLALADLGGVWAETLYGFWHPLNFPGSTVFAIPGAALAGLLIYWFNCRLSFRRTGLPAQTAHKLCLALAVATAPYTMLIPLYIW